MRGDSARLLASYPDHPGLLLARGLSEVLDSRGDLREFSSNLEASLRSAAECYDDTDGARNHFGVWLLGYRSNRRAGALATAIAVLERVGLAVKETRDCQLKALSTADGDVGVRFLALATILESAASGLDQVTRNYEGAHRER